MGYMTSLLRAIPLCVCLAFHGSARADVVGSLRAPTLGDIFGGTARFQTIAESEEVTLDFDLGGRGAQKIWDQKLPILRDETTGLYHAFTRASMKGTGLFRVVVLTSRDGVTFRQDAVLFDDLADPADNWTLYDPHIARIGDRYVMTLECANRQFRASICISETRTPFVSSSWSRPELIVRNSGERRQSASTGVAIRFGADAYLTWTVVDDGPTPFGQTVAGMYIVSEEDGNEATFSKGMQLREGPDGRYLYAGSSADAGRILVDVERNPYCIGEWDCNNVDIQDWKIEDGQVYAIYNGSNYYRCSRPNKDFDRSNAWHIAIRRANHPLGNYSEASGILIQSDVDNICGISYPTLNEIGGETYLYYSVYSYGSDGARINRTMRSRLIRDTPLAVTRDTARARVAIPLQAPVALAAPAARELQVDSVLQGRITRAYEQFLGRPPTTDEIDRQIAGIETQGYVATLRSIVLSPEHATLWPTRPTSGKIDSLYWGILARAPDAGGSRVYEALIEKEGASLDTLFGMFTRSVEFRNRFPVR